MELDRKKETVGRNVSGLFFIFEVEFGCLRENSTIKTAAIREDKRCFVALT